MTVSTSDSHSAIPSGPQLAAQADDPDLYRTLVEASLDLITLIDHNCVVIYQSPSSERVLGRRPQDMVGRNVLDFFHADDREASHAAIGRVLSGEVDIQDHLLRFQHGNGAWVRLECVARRWQGRGFEGLIVNSRDVSERSAMLSELERSNELLSKTFSASRNALTVSLPDTGQYVDVNEAWCEMFGYERHEAIGRTALDLNIWASTEQRQEVMERLHTAGRLRDYEVTVFTRNRAPLLLLLDAEILTVSEQARILMSATDITEARRTEAELRQSQKMEAVGQLTGGVAHDFNNLLGVVLGNAELLQDSLGHLPQAQRYVLPILRACSRGASLTQQLLAFSRRQALAPERIQLDDNLRRMLPLLRTTVSENTRVEVLASAGIWPCYVDPGQFESAMLNLALNARDAMPDGGQLELRVDNRTLTTDQLPELAPGDYLVVSVTDNGAGMDALVQQHVFEPFFTTKEPGRGTGLGLSMVFGFVTQSGGTVTVDSQFGRGTTVTLYLPRAEPQPEVPVSRRDTGDVPRARTAESVLVLEDNDSLRRLAVQQLTELGYHVLEAADEGQLRARLAAGAEPDLLISDVILTGRRRGPELAVMVREQLPQLAVLFMSGYLDDEIRTDASDRILAKPFSRAQFARAVRDALDA